MRWLSTEYLLKGIYLGLLVNIALFAGQEAAPTGAIDWEPLVILAACTGAGVIVALIVSAGMKLSQGYRVMGRPGRFLLFLLMESSILLYAGVILGTVAGIYLIRGPEPDRLFVPLVGLGAILGIIYSLIAFAPKRLTRIITGLLLGAAMMGLIAFAGGYLKELPQWIQKYSPGVNRPVLMSGFLFLGAPFFYLLTLAGRDEETEVEMASICALLGAGLLPIVGHNDFSSVLYLVPLFYLWYTFRALPKLRVWKYVLRGISYVGGGRFKEALLAFRRALQLDPRNSYAHEAHWRVHTLLDLDKLARDKELLALVDFNLCVERAGKLLMQKPTPEKMEQSHKLLDLVLSQHPEMLPQAMYWRAVGHCHTGNYDEAVKLLTDLIDLDKNDPNDAHRQAVLMQAWQLALLSLEVLKTRVGEPLLAKTGQRVEAIRVVEKHLAEKPDDEGVWPLKRLLYQGLTLQEFRDSCPEGQVPTAFDYSYARKLGETLSQEPEQWRRGLEFLEIALDGLMEHSPTLYSIMAEVYEREGQNAEAWKCYEKAFALGKKLGHKNFSDEEKQVWFGMVKHLGERARHQERLKDALSYYQVLCEWDRSGVETLRTMATLYERLEDPLAALRVTDRALLYNPKDPDLKERKDRYYYSVMPEQLKANLEKAANQLDVNYCLQKARSLLDHPQGDDELLDWAYHLLSLVTVVKPGLRVAKVLQARIHWRRGEMEQAKALLEQVREPRPEKFSSHEEEEAWYQSCQLLGDLYLNNFDRADLAVDCLLDFKKSSKSGAKTLFRLGEAYEKLGDTGRAIKCYTQVTAYEGNPLSYDAQDALDRLQSTSTG